MPTKRNIFHQATSACIFIMMVLSIPLSALGQIETGQWQTLSSSKVQEFPIFFPRPIVSVGSSELLVIPLFGPGHLLLPGGRLMIWVGRNDGTALANAIVTIRVPSTGNLLVSSGNRVTEICLRTNEQGMAEIFLTVPDAPPTNSTGNNSGGGPVAS